MWYIAWAEAGRIPDRLLRIAIRERIRRRLRAERRGGIERVEAHKRSLRARRAAADVTHFVDDANAQHYEVPTRLFELMLGPRLKYSSFIWPAGTVDLADAEEATLELTAARAGIADGHRVLDLGCGWGSFSLWAAARYPEATFTAVSNSRTQGDLIRKRAADAGLDNVDHVVADVGDLAFAPGSFDRIVSVEMLEHVTNHRTLFERMSDWLAPDGRAFVHVFTNRDLVFGYDPEDASDWIAQHFFSGGVMPSDDMFLLEQRDLLVVDHWVHSGRHYARTLEAWLERLDAHRAEALEVLAGAPDGAEVALQRWRMFLMISAELWAYRDGEEFLVSHYLFAPR